MVLTPGSWLGGYEVLAHVGAGGMGEVYRARDARLGRVVALKVLRDDLASESHGLDRFLREAQLLASLHHPNIASVFTFEESDGVRAIIQEFVDGPTLADRLVKGPLPPPDALAIARQIADALDAAHQRGIVHRDLKPSNIKLTTDGTVKLLDFGLAKAFSGDGEGTGSDSHTIAITQARTLLGTPAYMSPEQAVGAQVDRRADIWAFGCVLFEMISGRRAFDGPSASSVLAAAIHDDPPWDALPRDTPTPILRLLRRCLQKDARRRLRDIGDAFVEVDDGSGVAVERKPARRSIFVLAWIATGIAIGGVAVWALVRRPALPPTGPLLHASIVLESSGALTSLGHAFAVAPNGHYVAYVANADKLRRIWVRALDSFEARPLQGSEDGVNPFFSADSLWVGFFVERQLKKIALAGGAPIPVLDIEGPVRGARWGSDGAIIGGGLKVFRVPPNGAPEVIAESPDPRVDFRWPEILANGRTILVTQVTDSTEYEIATASVGNTTTRTVLKNAANPVVVGDYLVYTPQVSRDASERFRGLFAVKFDVNRVETSGAPFPVLENIHVRSGGAAQLSVAADGMLLWKPRPQREMRLVSVDRSGAMRPYVEDAGDFWRPRFSPDGKLVAFTQRGRRAGLYVLDLTRQSRERLATNGDDYTPAWSPDGNFLASTSDGSGGIAVHSLQVGIPPKRIEVGQHLHLGNWSSDGRFIVFEAESAETGWDVRALDVESHEVLTLVQTRQMEVDPAVSPDARWLAYASDQSGRLEVYVVPFRRPGRPLQISTEGGRNPEWSREGHELFFLSDTGLFATRVSLSPEFNAATPQLLFSGRFDGEFDVAPGAREFAMVAVEDPREQSVPLHVILNWTEQLDKRAAASPETRNER